MLEVNNVVLSKAFQSKVNFKAGGHITPTLSSRRGEVQKGTNKGKQQWVYLSTTYDY